MENNEQKQPVHVWQIGPDGTEYYAARSEQEMKAWYRQTVGVDAESDLAEHFEEIKNLDVKFPYNSDGEVRNVTWRELIAESVLPCQLATGYV